MSSVTPTMAALRRSIAQPPTCLIRGRQILVHFLSTQTHTPPQNPTATPDDIAGIKNSIRNAAAATPDDLASLFLQGLTHPPFLEDRRIFSLTVDRLASAGRRDLVASLLSTSLTSLPAPHPSEGFLIRLIFLYAAAGMPDHSLSTFRLVKPPSDRALSALLAAYHANKQYDRAVKAFHALPTELGIKPGVVSYNILLKSIAATGDVVAARDVLDEMPGTASVQPDIVSCNEVLKGYLNKGDHAAFYQLLKEITGGMRQLKPNVTTYNHRMAALCSKGMSFEAEELLNSMAAKGVPPNRGSFNTVIKGLCNEGEVSAAMAQFRRMPEVPRPNGTGVSPNFQTYIMLLEALVEKCEYDAALEVCKECLENKWAPPFRAVGGLIKGLVKARKVEHAKELAMAMKKAAKGDIREEWEKVEAAAFQLGIADTKA